MVIQCPSCSTKFSVDSAQLAGIANPRFHCSRCNHLFQSDEEVLPPNAVDENNSNNDAEEDMGFDFDNEANIDNGPDFYPEEKHPMTFHDGDGEDQVPRRALSWQEAREALKQSPQSARETVRSERRPAEPRAEQLELLPKEPRNWRTVLGNTGAADDDERFTVKAQWPDAVGNVAEAVGYVTNPRKEKMLPPTTRSAAVKPASGKYYTLDPAPHKPAGTVRSWVKESSSAVSRAVKPRLEVEEARRSGASAARTENAESRLAGVRQSLHAATHYFKNASTGWIDRIRLHVGTGSPDGERIAAGAPLVEANSSLDRKKNAGWVLQFPGRQRTPAFGAEGTSKPSAHTNNVARNSFTTAGGALETSVESPAAARRVHLFYGARALGYLFSFPLLFAACFWLWSKNLESTPLAIAEALHFTAEELPRVAPAGVELVDVNSSLVVLEDGQRVLEVHGNVVNTTLDSFRAVEIEAKVFDKDNKQLDRIIITANNALAGADRVNALPSASLKMLQERPNLNNKALRPNQRSPFRLVFTNPGEHVAWFSARVYSVTPEPEIIDTL